MAPTEDPRIADRQGYSAATRAVTVGRPSAAPNASLSPAVHLSSTYVARADAPAAGDVGYGRWGNLTWDAFEQALGSLEGGRALAFASGMAAVDAVIRQVPLGGLVVAPQAGYNGTTAMLDDAAARGLVRVHYVPVADTAAVTAALSGAALLWVESPTNPMLEVADLPALIAAGRRAGAVVAVDNTFATPLLQRPLELGADLVVHSVTKYLSGHSDLLLGAVVTQDPELTQALHAHRTRHGAIPGTFETWLALRGMRTLAVRVERSGANAAELAHRLLGHPALDRVRHPSLPADPGHARAGALMNGYGSIVAIEVSGGAMAAERVCAATRLWVPATSLGGVESTLERRRRHAGESELVPPALVRLSVGYPAPDVERELLLGGGTHDALLSLKPVATALEVQQLQAGVARVRVADELAEYVLAIVAQTRKSRLFTLGASPRGALALVRLAQARALLRGRDYVEPDDVKELCVPCLAHRVTLAGRTAAGDDADRLGAERAIRDLVDQIPAPD